MSSRVLKKLGLQGDSDIPKLEEASDSDTDFSNSSFKNRKFNRYNLLDDNSQFESEAKEDDDDDLETPETSQPVQNIAEKSDAKRKKRKKKKRSNAKHGYNVKGNEDNVEDEVERSVREVNELFGDEEEKENERNGHTPDVEIALTKEMLTLKVESRHLNPNNEFKRMFGSKVVNTSAELRRKARGRSIKNNVIVIPKETWIPIVKQGVSMKLLERKNNCSYFTFEHSQSYQEVQKQFLTAVTTLTPDNIVSLINHHPYHVDALIQLSELCKVGDDYAMAAELIERAVYALEMAFHPSFNVCRGDCRLHYLRQENRSFYVAVLKHIQFVGQRACYRTALELSKMLLSLSPIEDPLAIILCLDYYALRAKEYKWLIDFTMAWNSTRNLLKLPNFKYSIAVAHWYTNDFEAADACLKEAFILFPSFLMSLANKCGIQLNTAVTAHSFFTTFAEATESKPLKCLISLYVEQCQHVWKDPTLLPWLERNVQEVLAMDDAQDPRIIDCQAKRLSWFKSTLPVNIKRYLIIYDLTDILLVANEGLPSVILHFDPYPPSNSINTYSVPRRSNNSTSRRTGILASFFHALNPNVHYDGPDENEFDELAEEIGEVNQELRRSLRSIVNSIRGLLNTFDSGTRDAEGTVDGDAEDSESSSSDEGESAS